MSLITRKSRWFSQSARIWKWSWPLPPWCYRNIWHGLNLWQLSSLFRGSVLKDRCLSSYSLTARLIIRLLYGMSKQAKQGSSWVTKAGPGAHPWRRFKIRKLPFSLSSHISSPDWLVSFNRGVPRSHLVGFGLTNEHTNTRAHSHKHTHIHTNAHTQREKDKSR